MYVFDTWKKCMQTKILLTLLLGSAFFSGIDSHAAPQVLGEKGYPTPSFDPLKLSEPLPPQQRRYFIECNNRQQYRGGLDGAVQVAVTLQATGSKVQIRRPFRGTLFCGASVLGSIEPTSRQELENLGFSVTEVKRIRALLEESVPILGISEIVDTELGNNRPATGHGISIGIVDSGTDYGHPSLGSCTQSEFLSGRCSTVRGGYDFVNNDRDPMDDNGHGTHVAAIAAGRGPRGQGVATGAELYSLKVLGAAGYGFEDDIIAALEWALDPNGDGDASDHIDIVNLSLGSSGYPGAEGGPLPRAANRLSELGVLVVAAAGNAGGNQNNSTVGCPACASQVLAVAASNKEKLIQNTDIANFSSWGPFESSQGFVGKPELTAPGARICAARANGTSSDYPACRDDLGRIALSGTSMASPHVAGAAAILMELFPRYTTKEIRQQLMNLARPLPRTSANQSGLGVIGLAGLSTTSKAPPTIDLEAISLATSEGRATLRAIVHARHGVKRIDLAAAPSSAGDLMRAIVFREIEVPGAPRTYSLEEQLALPQAFESPQTILVSVTDLEGTTSRAWTQLRTVSGKFVVPELFETIAANTPYEVILGNNGPPIPTTFSLRNPLTERTTGTLNPMTLLKTSIYELIARQTMGQYSRVVSTFVESDENLRFGSPIQALTQPQLVVGKSSFTVTESNARSEPNSLITIAARCDEYPYMCSLELSSLRPSGQVNWSTEIGGTPNDILPPPIEFKDSSRNIIFTLSECSEYFGCRLIGVDRATGQYVPGWSGSSRLGLDVTAKPTIHLVPNGNGSDFQMVVFARYLIGSFYGETPYRVSVFNSSGQLVRQWSPEGDTDPLFEIGNTIATPAFGNFDQDSDMEIAFLIAAPGYVPGRDERSSLQVYNLDGTRLSGWPRQISGTYISSNVIAADLNRDGRDEIIAQTGCGANRSADCESVFAFMGDSSILPGWPSRIQVEGRRANFSELRSLAAADVDQDGSLEVLACFEAHGCTLLDRNGKVFKNSPKWPYVLEDLRGILSHGRGGPFLLDFDGDGSLEIAIIGVEGADDVSLGEPFGYRQRWKLRVLSNLGQRRLDLEQYLNEGALPDALYGRWAFGDWNGDSFLELHFGDRPPSHLNQPGHSRRSGHYVRDLTRKIPRSRLRWNGNGGDQRKLNRAE